MEIVSSSAVIYCSKGIGANNNFNKLNELKKTSSMNTVRTSRDDFSEKNSLDEDKYGER